MKFKRCVFIHLLRHHHLVVVKSSEYPRLVRTLTEGLLDADSVMNREITVSDIRITLLQVEVSCIVSSNYVKTIVIFLCIVHLYIIFLLYIKM